MKQEQNKRHFIVLISFLFLIGCNEPATTSEEKGSDTTSVEAISDTFTMPAYDPAMEPLTVGAKFSKKIGDTLNLKFYELTLKPGDSAALHTHPDHAVYVLQGGKLAVTFQGKGRQILDLKTGVGFISGPLSDASKNIGKTTIKLLVTDIYRPLGGGTSSMPAYNAALDPVTTGGSSIKLLHDTLNIKIFEGVLKPGELAPLHTHPDHAFYVLQGGKVAFFAQGAGRQELDLKTGMGHIAGPLTDSARNIGNTTIKTLEVDIYRPPGK